MLNNLIKIGLFFFISLTSVFVCAQTKTASSGNWNAAGTWSPSGVPGDNEVILIPAGVTVTVPGSDETMNNTILIIEGTLVMESTCGVCPNYGSLTFTGPDSGVIMEAGGQVQDGTAFGGDTHFISVDGETFWSGDNCSSNCGDVEGNYTAPEASSWPVGLSNPLPIELIEFTASVSAGSVEIIWKTAIEINNESFTIQRSNDALNWVSIAAIDGAGNSTNENSYLFIDKHPLPGLSYYRLMQTDYDGTTEYFEPTRVNNEQIDVLDTYPNPANDILNIITSNDLSNAYILVRDRSGQLLSVPITTSIHQAQLDVSDLAVGVYLLEVVFEGQAVRKRFIKQ